MKIRPLLLILQERHDIPLLSNSKITEGCQSIHSNRKDSIGYLNAGHSSLEGIFICSAQTANPTCAQSFDLHSSQNGIPSTIPTSISFFKILSCIDTTILLI